MIDHMKRVRIAVLAIALILPAAVFAESTSLHGAVRDEESGEGLSGASLLLLGTTIGASTDLDGEYRIDEIPPGTYNMRVSFVGYETKVVPNVRVEAGESEKLNVELLRQDVAAASYTIDDFVVTADRVLSTEIALITERMKAITIGDAISAERISKSPDGTSSDVLKRVTGLSVVDNKFVYVRGTTDRYSTTWLDGVATSSADTDVDRRSFAFDILPASLLASVVIVKTATPDLPGDFAGGLVQLNTCDIPDGRQFSASFSSAYDENTSTNGILRSEGSSTDWLGVDDGIRELPSYAPSGGNNYNELARELPNTWSTRTEKAPLNSSCSLSYGDRIDFGAEDGRHVLGLVAGFKYASSYERVEFVESPHDTGGYELYHKEGTRDRYKVIGSGLLNLAYTPCEGHQYTLRSLYMRDARDQVSYSEGSVNENSGPGGKTYTIEWDERSSYGLQFGGRHELGWRRGAELQWKLFLSNSTAREPDRKQADFQLRADGTHSLSENSRTWSDLYQRSRGARADFTLPFGRSKVKAGLYIEDRGREYRTDSFFTDTGTIRPPNYWIRVCGIDTIFVAENYDARKLTFRIKNTHTGEYDATHRLDAYYIMLDHPFSLGSYRFRLAGGARVEHSLQDVAALKKEGSEEPVNSRIDKMDVLPSINLTYMLTERANIRFSAFHSVNRPELREMADVKYFDFNEGANVQGNPDLKRSVIKNYDVRLEAFPGGDEVLAVSCFYKDLYDAIELKMIPSSDYKYVRTWFNSPRGYNYGFEIEARKQLGFLGGFLDDFTIAGNYAWVHSSVEYLYEWRWQDDEGDWHTGREIRTRPLQGQSPWTVNLTLLYEHPRLGTSVSVLYNKIARRLYSVSGERDGDLWQESREVLDLVVTQKLFDQWELKLSAKNLMASDDVKTMGPERSVHTKESRGAAYSLSIGFGL